MLTEEVARLAQVADAARTDKASLVSQVQEKTRKIAFLYEEKDMLLQHLRQALDACSQENAQLRQSLEQSRILKPLIDHQTQPKVRGCAAQSEFIGSTYLV